MRILVAIANYGTGNRRFLDQLVDEYRSMRWDVDIVILSNIPKTVPPGVEVRVGLPARNPWSLPFGHRAVFSERRDEYDLFVYSEDDTLVRSVNIEAFLRASALLGPNDIPGFMRTETDVDGEAYVSSMHGFFRWAPEQMVCRGGELFVPFTNDHSACYLITRDQLQRAIASGGFVVRPYEGRYDMLCTAATDVYTRCGLKRYICISRLADFLLPHLPNKYIGRMGVPLLEVENQVEALKCLASTQRWRGPLFEVETGLKHGEWSKNLYEQPDPELLALIPAATRRLLSVGCGWGATEAVLAERGVDVTAVPVDAVFGDALRRRGIQTLEGPFPAVLNAFRGDRFDCVLLNDVLHLVPDPIAWLTAVQSLIKRNGGTVVLSVPNTRDIVTRLKSAPNLTAGASSGPRMMVPRIGRRELKNWMKAAGFVRTEIRPMLSPRRQVATDITLGVFRTVLAHRFVARANVS